MGTASEDLDAVIAAPEHHKVLLEDERIRVLETLLKPGEITRIHTHAWGGFLYIVSWSDFIRYDGEGRIMLQSQDLDVQPIPGTAIWAPPLPPHALRNVGDRDIHVILTELKDNAGSPTAEVTLPASSRSSN